MPADPVAVGVDVGGTKIAAAAIGPDGTLRRSERGDSPIGDEAALVAAVAELTAAAADGRELPVGVGFAGIVDRDGVVRYGPNVDVVDLPLRAQLAAAVGGGGPVTVVNDASAAAWGELCAGAGQDVDDLVLLTLGTGVGGGVIVDSQLLEGANGFAGEVGHLLVHDGGRRCGCGNRGCLEAYASGTAVEAMVRERLAAADGGGSGADSTLDPATLTGRDIAAAAGAGDGVATAVLDEAGRWLGVAVASLVNVLDPSAVVVGGGAVAGYGPYMLPAARRVAAARTMGGAHRPDVPIVEATLGNDAGMVGAGLLAAHRA